MFQYFPNNYVWSLSVAIALESGGKIGEVDEICKPLLEAARAGDDPGTGAFFAGWCAMADKLLALADEDLAAVHTLSAGSKRLRASLYYLTAERMQRHGLPERQAIYARALSAFADGVAQAGQPCTRVEIPHGGAHIAGLFVPAAGSASSKAGSAPCVVHVNGLDSVKELLYFNGLAQSLARRGVASLLIDQPGTGEALRLHGMTAVVQSERWASPVLDWLQAGHLPSVDPARIALLGVSLGGYYAPRAVAFDPRWAAGAVWGANHDWGEIQRRRRAREGERPVPHYWDHVMWVWGAPDLDAFMDLASQVHLDGVLDRVRVPFLITHGENDRQIPLEYARRSFDALTNSPQRELMVFTSRQGGVEHSSLDNMANAGDAIADWLAGTLR